MKKHHGFLMGLSLLAVLSLASCTDTVSPHLAKADSVDAGTASKDGTAAANKDSSPETEKDDKTNNKSPENSPTVDATESADDPMANVDVNKKITVRFDPYDGHFYYVSGKTQNPDRVEILPGPVNEPPQPWKEGHAFQGWYTDYWAWQNKWDFSEVIVEDMQLYAYFVESDTPDEKPAVSQIVNNLYDMGLEPTPITEFDAGKDTKTFWAKGVSESGGWEDHRQYTNNCWGTASSQMLDWFFKQDKFKDVLAKNGNAPKTIDATRKWFLDLHGEWGWFISSALSAYFDRLFPGQGLEANMYNYSGGSKPFTLDTLSALLYRHLSRGDIGGLAGLMFAGQPHAMSLWGAEFDKDGIVVALWLTTSECTKDEEVLKPRLNKYVRKDAYEEGHYQWDAFYEYVSSAGGYAGSQHTFVMDIYMLSFLSAADAQ